MGLKYSAHHALSALQPIYFHKQQQTFFGTEKSVHRLVTSEDQQHKGNKTFAILLFLENAVTLMSVQTSLFDRV